MNKKYLFLFLFLFVLVFSIPIVKIEIINVFDFLKTDFFSSFNNFRDDISNIINQSKKIKELKLQNYKLQKKIVVYNSILGNCEDLKNFIFVKDSNLVFSKIVSYADLPDFTKFYITYVGKNYPRGLVYNNLVAGIAVKRVGNYSLAFLNNNKKVSYTIYILDNGKKIPGIFKGGENIIKYIPKFAKIKKGDLVVTNGLDGLFYEGAKVGIIKSVKNENLYKEAKVKLFYDSNAPNYFYVVKKLKGVTNGNTKH